MTEAVKTERERGQYRVIGPDEGEAFWQPQPSTGWSEIKVSPYDWGSNRYSSGVQVLMPGAHVREHAHQRNEEMIFIWQGEGVAHVNDVEFDLKPGSLIVVDRFAQHKITNTGDVPLRMFWVIMPPGLENWVAAIGKPRDNLTDDPPVFDRPENVADVQRAMFFEPPSKPVDET